MHSCTRVVQYTYNNCTTCRFVTPLPRGGLVFDKPTAGQGCHKAMTFMNRRSMHDACVPVFRRDRFNKKGANPVRFMTGRRRWPPADGGAGAGGGRHPVVASVCSHCRGGGAKDRAFKTKNSVAEKPAATAAGRLYPRSCSRRGSRQLPTSAVMDWPGGATPCTVPAFF